MESIKKHWVVTSVITLVGAISAYGAFFGGLDSLRKTFDAVTAKPKIEPDVKLGLVNVDMSVAPDGTNQKPGQYRINFSAILRNLGADPIRSRVSEVTSSVAEFKPDRPGGDFPELTIGPSLSVNADMDSISFPLKAGQYLEGRIDWRVKYGPADGDLTETMKISGAVGIRLRQKKPFLTWTPDADSERPVGMIARVTNYDAESGKTPAEAAVDAEVAKTAR